MTPKTTVELRAMKEGGSKLASVLQALLTASKPGVSLVTLESRAIELIKKTGGTPSFQTVQGYQWATCLCVNEVVVHGIPSSYKLREADVLTVDVGLLYKGLHTDTAWTKIVESAHTPADPQKERFLRVGQEALWKGIDQAQPGNRVGDISKTIQMIIEGAGYSIVRSLVGHGVGKELHEDPQIPGFLKGSSENTPLLVPGETVAIEVIYAMGRGDVVYENDDGWSIATRDRSLSAVFEHTIEITEGKPIVLTK